MQAEEVEIVQVWRDDFPVGVEFGRVADAVIQADDLPRLASCRADKPAQSRKTGISWA